MSKQCGQKLSRIPIKIATDTPTAELAKDSSSGTDKFEAERYSAKNRLDCVEKPHPNLPECFSKRPQAL